MRFKLFNTVMVLLFCMPVQAENQIKGRLANADLLGQFDPTVRPLTLVNTSKEIKSIQNTQLTMIYVGDDDRFAVINNKVYRKGDSFGPYVVSEVESDKILVLKSDEVYTIKLVTPL